MTPPRILLVAPSAYALGGLATWLDYLVPGLRAAGWDAILGLVQGPRHHNPAAYLDSHPCDAHVVIHARTGTLAGRHRALADAFRRLRPDAVVSVNMPDVYRAVQQLRSERQPAPRCVMANHGLQCELFADAGLYAPALDAAVSTNRLGCALLEQAGISPERVLYAPCGAACEATLPDRPRPKAGVFRVLYSGRLEQAQKRVLDLPGILHSASGRLGPVVCEVAGDGPEADRLRQALAAVAPGVRIEFPGFLAPAAMPQAYRRADALLMTSSWETGPLVVWEAMAAGLPVVSSRYVGSGLEGALADGVNGLLFDVGDVRGAADALVRLATEPGLAKRLREAAHALVVARYSLGASVAQWDRALRRTLDMPALPVPPAPSAPRAAGRLDRWLGPSWAESVRAVLRLRHRHRDAGGEWPHAHSRCTPEHRAEFFEVAEELDRPASGQPSKD